RLGTAMRALANDREITATLGVPVRQVEAAAWFGCGLVCGAAGLLLADQLGQLAYDALTFTFVIGGIAAALIGRLRSLWLTLVGGMAVRAVAIAAVLLIALLLLPQAPGDWVSTFTTVAIYSVVAAGLGILYGRVGMISLGQIGILVLAVWIGARLSFASSLP